MRPTISTPLASHGRLHPSMSIDCADRYQADHEWRCASLVVTREHTTCERTRTINALTALVRTVELVWTHENHCHAVRSQAMTYSPNTARRSESMTIWPVKPPASCVKRYIAHEAFDAARRLGAHHPGFRCDLTEPRRASHNHDPIHRIQADAAVGIALDYPGSGR